VSGTVTSCVVSTRRHTSYVAPRSTVSATPRGPPAITSGPPGATSTLVRRSNRPASRSASPAFTSGARQRAPASRDSSHSTPPWCDAATMLAPENAIS